MSDAASGAKGSDDADGLLEQLAHQLHEICQPLTALQCRLEIERMEREGKEPGTVDTTLAECMRECDRLNERVSTMRTLLGDAMMRERENRR